MCCVDTKLETLLCSWRILWKASKPEVAVSTHYNTGTPVPLASVGLPAGP